MVKKKELPLAKKKKKEEAKPEIAEKEEVKPIIKESKTDDVVETGTTLDLDVKPIEIKKKKPKEEDPNEEQLGLF